MPDMPVDQRDPDLSCVVYLQEGDSKTRLFCVHEVAGVAGVYRGLASALGPAYTVVGLQAFWLKGGRPPLSSIPAMASYYAAQVEIVQPTGPYFLYGWSSGGLIALEMAHELISHGHTVALLALGDTHLPSPTPDLKAEFKRRWKLYFAIACGRPPQNIDDDAHLFWTLGPEDRLVEILDAARRADHRPFLALMAMCSIQAHFSFFWNFCEAVHQFRPRPYPGHIVFLEAIDDGARCPGTAWTNIALGGCTILPIPGNHVSIMRPPLIHTLAETLTPYLTLDNQVTVHPSTPT